MEPTVNAPVRDSAALIAAFGLTSLANYAFSVALSWFLTPSEFGLVGVAQSLLLLAGLAVGSGFSWSASHDLAAYGPGERSRRTLRTALIANAGLGLLLASVMGATSRLGLPAFGPENRLVLPLVGLTTLLLALRAVANGAARGAYRFRPLAANLAGEAFLKALAGLALVIAGAGVAGVMAGFAVGAAAALLHSLWIIRKLRFWEGVGWFDSGVVRASLPMFLGMLGPALMLNLDILGLKLLAPAQQADELAGLYQAAVVLARIPVFAAQSLAAVSFSYVAGRREALDGAPLAGYFRAAVKAWLRLLLPAALVLAVAPGAALSVFFPEAYQGAAGALRISAAGAALLAMATLLMGILQAAGERRRPALVAVAGVTAQLGVLALLAPRLGALAAALSLLAAGLVSSLGLTAIAARYVRPTRLAWRRITLERAVAALLPYFLLLLPLLALPRQVPGSAPLKLLLAGAGYCLALLVVHQDQERRSGARIRQQLARFVHVLMGE